MKIPFLSLLLIGLLSLSLTTACGNDDDNDGPNSIVTIDGVDYELTKGFIESSPGLDPGDFDVFVYLTGEGISTVQGDFTGSGPFVILSFITTADNALPNGTYSVASGNFDGAGALVNADFSANVEIDQDDALIGTTVTVSGTDSAKEIVLNFTRQNGSSGTLNYVGPLQVLN